MFAIASVASLTTCRRRRRSGSRAPARQVLRRHRVTAEPAEDGPHGEGARSEHVVVELVGELERRLGVLSKPLVKRVAQARRQ